VSAGGPRLGLALLVLASAQLMVVLDATIVNVALPRIPRSRLSGRLTVSTPTR
jgi:hypothetical protein